LTITCPTICSEIAVANETPAPANNPMPVNGGRLGGG